MRRAAVGHQVGRGLAAVVERLVGVAPEPFAAWLARVELSPPATLRGRPAEPGE